MATADPFSFVELCMRFAGEMLAVWVSATSRDIPRLGVAPKVASVATLYDRPCPRWFSIAAESGEEAPAPAPVMVLVNIQFLYRGLGYGTM